MLQNLGFDPSINIPTQPQGMFGGGNWRNALLAAAAGFMARRSPGVAGNIINGLQDAQTLKEKLAIAQQERAQAVQDQIAVHQAERQFDVNNPLPTSDSEFERVAAAGGYTPGTPEYAALMKRKADAMANPIVMTAYGPMPYSSVAGAAQAPQVIQSLPPGAKPIGGSTPPASSGFPGPY